MTAGTGKTPHASTPRPPPGRTCKGRYAGFASRFAVLRGGRWPSSRRSSCWSLAPSISAASIVTGKTVDFSRDDIAGGRSGTWSGAFICLRLFLGPEQRDHASARRCSACRSWRTTVPRRQRAPGDRAQLAFPLSFLIRWGWGSSGISPGRPAPGAATSSPGRWLVYSWDARAAPASVPLRPQCSALPPPESRRARPTRLRLTRTSDAAGRWQPARCSRPGRRRGWSAGQPRRADHPAQVSITGTGDARR